MCRNIKPLFNFDPPATREEMRAASEQLVRKVSGFTHPSQANEEAFNEAVDKITEITAGLMHQLTTHAHPHNREEEARKAHIRAVKRFGR